MENLIESNLKWEDVPCARVGEEANRFPAVEKNIQRRRKMFSTA